MSPTLGIRRPSHALHDYDGCALQDSGCEAEILWRTAEMLIPGRCTRIGHLIRQCAPMDAALVLFRTALPQCGFKLVAPPPLAGGGRPPVVAAVWRRDDAYAASQRAATPALALLLAAEHKRAEQMETELSLACRFCGGLGWFISTGGTKEICRHRDA